MALRRLSVAHSWLRAAVRVRSASTTTESEWLFENEKPICPGNAFTLFLETQARDGKSLKKHIYEAACNWNKLSQEDKRIFQLKAKELEKKYKDEVSKWETRMCQKGRKDLVERHHQLTDGKNLAIARSQAAEMDHDQDSMVTTEENVSHVMEEEKLDTTKEPVKYETEAVIKREEQEGKNILMKETEKEEKLQTSMKKTEKDQLHTLMKKTKREKLHTSVKEMEKEETLHTSVKKTKKKGKLSSSVRETEKKEKLHTSMKETEKEEELHTMVKGTETKAELYMDEALRDLSEQSSKSSIKPFRSKQKQIVVVKKRKSFSW